MIAKKRKKEAVSKKWSNKKRVLIVAIAVIFLTIYGAVVYRVYDQQRTMNVLESAGKDLRVIYDKILLAEGSNVSNSYFHNECSESSVEIGRGDITCGSSGYVTMRAGIAQEDAQKMVVYAVNRSDIKEQITDIESSYGGREIYSKYSYESMKVNCLVNHATNSTYYMTCRKSVPDFLPGYVVEK